MESNWHKPSRGDHGYPKKSTVTGRIERVRQSMHMYVHEARMMCFVLVSDDFNLKMKHNRS